jgi:hypothetical protein
MSNIMITVVCQLPTLLIVDGVYGNILTYANTKRFLHRAETEAKICLRLEIISFR